MLAAEALYGAGETALLTAYLIAVSERWMQ